MAQTSISVLLSDPLKEYVDARVTHGEYGTPSDYLRDLIRKDRDQRRTALEEELLEALDSGNVELSREELTGGNFVASLKARLAERNAR